MSSAIETPAPIPGREMHPLMVRLITVGLSAAVSGLIAWGTLQQQLKQFEQTSTDMRQEMKEMRALMTKLATDQARAATAIEYIGRAK